MHDLGALPFSIHDLNPVPEVDTGPPVRVRCYARGCPHLVRPPSPDCPGEVCPDHGIYCHRSSRGATYSYADPRRNAIVAAGLLADRVIGNPHKYETGRLGNENSEDALVWNVFRTLQECGLLHVVGVYVTGLEVREEPRLYLWGLSARDDRFGSWDLLAAARQRFESNLPVERPPTEPDIALHLPGRYLVLVEAKFTSPNPYYTDGPRRDAQSLTKAELLDTYQDPKLVALDLGVARGARRVHYQLWRNVVFAEWTSQLDGPGTVPFVANLTRVGYEAGSCAEFRSLIRSDASRRFIRITWEGLRTCLPDTDALGRLRQYLDSKTANLKPAFDFGSDGG